MAAFGQMAEIWTFFWLYRDARVPEKSGFPDFSSELNPFPDVQFLILYSISECRKTYFWASRRPKNSRIGAYSNPTSSSWIFQLLCGLNKALSFRIFQKSTLASLIIAHNCFICSLSIFNHTSWAVFDIEPGYFFLYPESKCFSYSLIFGFLIMSLVFGFITSFCLFLKVFFLPKEKLMGNTYISKGICPKLVHILLYKHLWFQSASCLTLSQISPRLSPTYQLCLKCFWRQWRLPVQ